VFAGRVPASLQPSPWARRLERLRAGAAPLLDLADHDPTAAELGYLEPGLLAALADPAGLAHTPSARGLRPAREAVAAHYAGRGLAVDPGQVVLVASTSEAYAHAFRLFAEPGGRFLVPRPGYPLCEPLAAAEAVTLGGYPLVLAGGAWRLDLPALAAALPGARGVVAVHPGHPAGSFLERGEAQALAGLCARHGVPLLVDEVFAEFHDGQVPGARPATGLRTSFVDEEQAVTLVFAGLSKTCGLPQLKLGWIIVSGPRAEREEVLERLDWLADAFLSVGGPVQHALPALLANASHFQAAVRARVRANRATLASALAGVPGAALLPADGGWSAVVALPPGTDEETAALALLEHGVVVHPGYFYEFAEPGWLVLGLLAPPDRFARGAALVAAVAGG
jgi:aspartate/methionine/tyrosine aminotransferase